jgi:hypothetical protein
MVARQEAAMQAVQPLVDTMSQNQVITLIQRVAAAVAMVALALMHLQIIFPVRLMLLVEMAVLEPLI